MSHQNQKSRYLYWTFLTMIVGGSFRIFSSYYYPLLNSDDAISILMIEGFSLKKDLFCWGQDRGGSLVPLLANLLSYILPLGSIWLESIVRHLILLLGYFSFASFLPKIYQRLLFALIWFLPPIYFIGLVRYPMGIQYAILGMALLMIRTLAGSQIKVLTRLSL